MGRYIWRVIRFLSQPGVLIILSGLGSAGSFLVYILGYLRKVKYLNMFNINVDPDVIFTGTDYIRSGLYSMLPPLFFQVLLILIGAYIYNLWGASFQKQVHFKKLTELHRVIIIAVAMCFVIITLINIFSGYGANDSENYLSIIVCGSNAIS